MRQIMNTPARGLIATSAAGLGAAALALGPRAARRRRRCVQLSWLHSRSFAGSYIAQDRVTGARNGLRMGRFCPVAPTRSPVEHPWSGHRGLVGISRPTNTAACRGTGRAFSRSLGVATARRTPRRASLPANPVERACELVASRIGMAPGRNTPVCRRCAQINARRHRRASRSFLDAVFGAAALVGRGRIALLCWKTDPCPVAMSIEGPPIDLASSI